jgi:hypothetical protein
MRNLVAAVRTAHEFHLWTSGRSSGLPGELTLLEFLFASYKQLAGVHELTMNSTSGQVGGAQDQVNHVPEFICATLRMSGSGNMASVKTDYEFHLWTREWS